MEDSCPTFKIINKNKGFVGRKAEIERLERIKTGGEAAILVVYGRRRVGKTELLEQTFRDRNVLKFEGIEGAAEKDQISTFLYQLAEYANEPLIKRLSCKSWLEVLDVLAPFVMKGKRTLYFEEVQWLANYSGEFVSHLKYMWDNKFKQNPELILILCGSSPSFMINNILHSRALYNRSQHEIPLGEFDLLETCEFLGSRRSPIEIMDAYLLVGGIPEYLKYLKSGSSVLLSLCENSFRRGGFFVDEHKRIFISSLASNPHYQKIIAFLSKRKYATRIELARHLKLKSGGSLTNLLKDLELCGFIARYVPFNVDEGSMLSRYCIADQYLQFYFKFVQPKLQRIQNGDFGKNPVSGMKMEDYKKWLGFAFERLCRRYHALLANILGFGGVRYRFGSFFSRSTDKEMPGYQIDLVFDRDDRVYTICEIKYYDSKVGNSVISDMQRKIELFPNPKGRPIQKILITPFGCREAVSGRGYFERVITLDDIFDERFWQLI